MFLYGLFLYETNKNNIIPWFHYSHGDNFNDYNKYLSMIAYKNAFIIIYNCLHVFDYRNIMLLLWMLWLLINSSCPILFCLCYKIKQHFDFLHSFIVCKHYVMLFRNEERLSDYLYLYMHAQLRILKFHSLSVPPQIRTCSFWKHTFMEDYVTLFFNRLWSVVTTMILDT